MPGHPKTVEFRADADLPVRVVRSTRRQKTISSQWRNGILVINVPAALSEQVESRFVDDMVKKFRQKQGRANEQHSDTALALRAEMLDAQYFQSAANPSHVRWVDNQKKRWGSASLQSRRIRLSSTLHHTPQWVQDYVLVHELVHLIVPDDGHGPQFKQLLARYERADEAKRYLEAFTAGHRAYAVEQGLGSAQDPDDDFDDLL